nr:MAG TPA: hypothetical protein [Caudoviricetes sp.]
MNHKYNNKIMELLKFIFSSGWHFIGCLILINVTLRFLLIVWNRLLRHLNILKNGYPPIHCDADGDVIVK